MGHCFSRPATQRAENEKPKLGTTGDTTTKPAIELEHGGATAIDAARADGTVCVDDKAGATTTSTQPACCTSACGTDSRDQRDQHSGAPWDLLGCGVQCPPNESQRWKTHAAMGLLDAPHSEELDMLVDLITRVFDAPYSSVALYYNRRCWLTNTKHIMPGLLPWQLAACPWNCLVTQPHTIVSADALEDARFQHQPWAHGGLRCYCSAPLLAANGHRLGTICFMDSEPRKVDIGMCRVLNNFGELAVRILERHVKLAQRLAAAQAGAVAPELSSLIHAARAGQALLTRSPSHRALLKGPDEGYWVEGDGPADDDPATAAASPEDVLLASLTERLLRSPEVARDACVLIVDTAQPGWPVVWADDTWVTWAGFPRSELLGRGLWDSVRSGTHGVAPINLESLQAQADATERFVVPGVVAVTPASRHASGNISGILTTGHTTMLEGVPEYACAPTSGTHAISAVSSRVQDLDQSAAALCWNPVSEPNMVHDKRPSELLPAAAVSAISVPALSSHAGGSQLSGHGSRRDGANTPVPSFPVTSLAREGLGSVADRRLGANPGAGRTSGAASGQLSSLDLLMASGGADHGTEALFAHVADLEHDTRSSMDVKRQEDAAAHGMQLGHAAAGGMHSVSRSSFGHAKGHAGVAGQRLIDLSFRPLALDLLDSDTLPIGVPSWVELKATTPMLRLYAVRLHEAGSLPPPLQPLTPSMKVLQSKRGGLHALSAHMFPGLKIGHVLGSGGYGTAYLGTWHDAPVVLKAQDYTLNDEQELYQAQLEVSLGQLLRHPNLVRTLGHGSAEVHSSSNSRSVHDPNPSTATCSRTFHASIPDWSFDDEDELLNDSKWFSHCRSSDLKSRDMTAKVAPELLAGLPAAALLVNNISVARDAVLGGHSVSRLSLEHITEEPFSEEVSAATTPHRHTLPQALGAAAVALPVPESGTAASAGLPGRASADSERLTPFELTYIPMGGAAPLGRPGSPRRTDPPAGPHMDGLNSSRGSSGPPSFLGAHLRPGGWSGAGGPPSQSSWAATGLSRAWSVSSSARGPDGPVSDELRHMMATSELQAEAVKAEPLSFPLHLRTLAVQELCDGGTLLDAVDRGWLRLGDPSVLSPPDLGKVARLGIDIARGCAYLHSRGVVHADLSASNVLLCRLRATVPESQAATLALAPVITAPPGSAASGTPPMSTSVSSSATATTLTSSTGSTPASLPESYPGKLMPEEPHSGFRLPIRSYTLAPQQPRQGQDWQFVAKVADFGRSRLLSAEGVADAGGYATITQMAPEVLRYDLLTPAADVYALGVLLWQMFTGSRPWAGMSHRQIIAIVSGGGTLEWKRHAALPAAAQPAADVLTEVGAACCAQDPALRPTMVQVAQVLEGVLRLVATS